MIALQYSKYGEPSEVLAPVDASVPEPGEGEVRLRLLRSPIHNHDLATIRGNYGVKPKLPAVAGSEMIGIVEALGPGAQATVGARVASMGSEMWREYAIARADSLVPIPDGVPDDTGAQLLAMPLSAVVLFDELRVKPGDWVVQNAAGGAVGRILCRLIQDAGANCINLVRSAAGVESCTRYGAKHVVVTDSDEWPKRVREIAGGAPIARVVDSIADSSSFYLNRLLGKLGEHVVFGGLGGSALKLDPGALIFNESIVRGFWMMGWMQRAERAQVAGAMMRVFAMLQKGELPLPVAGVYPLKDAAAAMLAAEQPGRPGKVLLSA